MSTLDLTKPLRWKRERGEHALLYISHNPKNHNRIIVVNDDCGTVTDLPEIELENVPETVHCVVAVVREKDREDNENMSLLFKNVEEMQQFLSLRPLLHLLSFVEVDIDI